MRYESVADMPQGVRQRVIPVVLEKALKERTSGRPIKIDGVTFDNGHAAARYLYLMEAQDKGIIKGLRIREKVTMEEPYVQPGGAHVKGLFTISDFSYTVADFQYRDGFREDDLMEWEAISEQAPGERVFEFIKDPAQNICGRMREKGLLWRKVQA